MIQANTTQGVLELVLFGVSLTRNRTPQKLKLFYFFIFSKKFARTICALLYTNQAIQITNWSSHVEDHREVTSTFLIPLNPYRSLLL